MGNSVSEHKRELRRRFRAERDGLVTKTRDSADARIARRVCALAAWRQADVVLAYYATGSEVSTRPLIEEAWLADKTVALPRCNAGNTLSWYRVGPGELDALAPGSWGIPEPEACSNRLIDPAALRHAVALVPGLAYDRQGFRLGYGGGYYDRFLAGFSGVALGLCRSAQLVWSLGELGALDAYDRAVACVVTEEGPISCAAGHQAGSSASAWSKSGEINDSLAW